MGCGQASVSDKPDSSQSAKVGRTAGNPADTGSQCKSGMIQRVRYLALIGEFQRHFLHFSLPSILVSPTSKFCCSRCTAEARCCPFLSGLPGDKI